MGAALSSQTQQSQSSPSKGKLIGGTETPPPTGTTETPTTGTPATGTPTTTMTGKTPPRAIVASSPNKTPNKAETETKAEMETERTPLQNGGGATLTESPAEKWQTPDKEDHQANIGDQPRQDVGDQSVDQAEKMARDWRNGTRAEAEQHMGEDGPNLARFWDQLSGDERQHLMEQFDSLHLPEAKVSFQQSALPRPDEKGREEDGVYRDQESLQGIDDDHYAVRKNLNEEQLAEYWRKGLEVIADGKVAVIVLAGGQATRLGADHPKGTLSLHLDGFRGPDSLLAIQAARIARLERLAAKEFPDSSPRIQWLIMTSGATRRETEAHLARIAEECGLQEQPEPEHQRQRQPIVFTQRDFPCFALDGAPMLANRATIATAPNGNGGLYEVLAPFLAQLRANGIQYVHVYCVDNVLCRVADPHFIGYCAVKQADCAAKAVEKVDPHEAVGVICRQSGKVGVVEYSEISSELAEKRDGNGRLMLRAGNIANHFFTLDFLENVCKAENRLRYHRAVKKIPYVGDDGATIKPDQPNGIKLEQFVFDVFEYAKNFHVWEVSREEEFSPLKNADSVGKDCMKTCREDMSNQCRKWLQNAGAILEGDGQVFIHPLRSYAGEDLEEFHDSHITTPTVLNYN